MVFQGVVLDDNQIFFFRLSLIFYVLTMITGAPIDFDNMRSRELRKHLLKWGHSRDELSKILDRKELRTLAEDFYSQKQKFDDEAAFKAKGVQVSIICIVIACILVFWEPLLGVLSHFRSSIDGFIYQIKERLQLVKMCISNRYPVAALSLIAATGLEFIQPCIHLSVLAGWIIPTGSVWRRFLIPMPNFSLTMNHLLGDANPGSTPSQSRSRLDDLGNMGINVAPMVLLWVSNYLKHKLEDFGASRLIKVIDAKQRRRHDREAVRNFRAKVQAEEDYVTMDFADKRFPTANDDLSCTGNVTSTNSEERASQAEIRGPSPFEQEMSNRRSSFLQHVREGSKLDFEPVYPDESELRGASTLDDGDFWFNDSKSELLST
jgi:hypothetical protein